MSGSANSSTSFSISSLIFCISLNLWGRNLLIGHYTILTNYEFDGVIYLYNIEDFKKHESYSDYLKEVLDGSVTTFINSYPQLYKVWDGGGDYDEMFEFIYDFMLTKFNDKSHEGDIDW